MTKITQKIKRKIKEYDIYTYKIEIDYKIDIVYEGNDYVKEGKPMKTLSTLILNGNETLNEDVRNKFFSNFINKAKSHVAENMKNVTLNQIRFTLLNYRIIYSHLNTLSSKVYKTLLLIGLVANIFLNIFNT